jgi:hypothetical protein
VVLSARWQSILKRNEKSAMRRLVLVLVSAALVQQAFGWGDEGHKAINKAAAGKATQSMPVFLRKASARIEYLGPEPDRWRHKEEFSVKYAQEPDHFIDLERVDWMKELPKGRYAFYRALYEKRAQMNGASENGIRPDDLLPERVGLQPYIAMEVYDRLKIAFREYRRMKAAHQSTVAVEQNIIFYMGWLGHYVGDGSNPLHTTIRYNGWVGDNPNGYTTARKIHWMMEGQFVGANINQLPFADMVKAPVKLDDPWTDYQKYLRESQKSVELCYQLEQSGGFVGAGTKESREFIRERLAAGAQMLANMWYTAWVESEKEPEKPVYD